MSTFSRASHPALGGSRVAETVMEIGMTVAAAGLTAVIWVSVGAWVVLPAATAETTTAESASAQAPMQVTLPTVVIVGHREVEGTPVTTTAQNTASIPVTLR
jgi:hypothetical protein